MNLEDNSNSNLDFSISQNLFNESFLKKLNDDDDDSILNSIMSDEEAVKDDLNFISPNKDIVENSFKNSSSKDKPEVIEIEQNFRSKNNFISKESLNFQGFTKPAESRFVTTQRKSTLNDIIDVLKSDEYSNKELDHKEEVKLESKSKTQKFKLLESEKNVNTAIIDYTVLNHKEKILSGKFNSSQKTPLNPSYLPFQNNSQMNQFNEQIYHNNFYKNLPISQNSIYGQSTAFASCNSNMQYVNNNINYDMNFQRSNNLKLIPNVNYSVKNINNNNTNNILNYSANQPVNTNSINKFNSYNLYNKKSMFNEEGKENYNLLTNNIQQAPYVKFTSNNNFPNVSNNIYHMHNFVNNPINIFHQTSPQNFQFNSNNSNKNNTTIIQNNTQIKPIINLPNYTASTISDEYPKNIYNNLIPFSIENSHNKVDQNNNINHSRSNYSTTKELVKPSIDKKLTQIKENSNLEVDYLDYQDNEIGTMSFDLAKEQIGCRYLQNKMDEEDFTEKYIIPNIINHILELSYNLFGNYFIQKLLTKIKPQTYKVVLDIILKDIVNLSYNQYGTRVVQKLIETLPSKKQIYLIRQSIESNLVEFMKNLNSYHVVLKCIQNFPENNNIYIYDIIRKNLEEICLDKVGCSSIQKFIDIGSESKKLSFHNKIISLTVPLLSNQNGSYVLLYLINLKNQNYLSEIIDKIKQYGSLKQYINNKLSNIVFEKCMDLCNDEDRLKMINSINFEEDLISLLMDNQGIFSKFLI